jgi:carbonic anhydrase/acetyltransferase-like protein (isoleucine patch superfamily)
MSAHILPFQGHRPQLDATNFIAPTAVVIGQVKLGTDTSVWYQTVLRGDVHTIEIGARTNLQDGTVVHVSSGNHFAQVGDDCTIGHRAIIHGCIIGNRVLVGMGAIVLDGAVIGDDCIIGAGSVVTPGTQIPAGSMVMGAPARVVRQLREGEVAFLPLSALHYVQNAAEHMAMLAEQR